MAEPPEWRTPAIGLVVIAGLLLVGGGIKLSAANRPTFWSAPTKAKRYPKRKPYRPKPPPVVPQPRPQTQRPQTQRTQAQRPRRPRTTARRPVKVDNAPGAEDRAILRSDPDGNARAFAATSLATYRPVQDSTITVLMEALRDEDALVRSSAADTLGQLGRSARRARSALFQLTRDPDPEVRRAVKAALRKIR